MKIIDRILNWIYANAKIRKVTVINLLDALDADQDGYIEASEIVTAIRGRMVKR